MKKVVIIIVLLSSALSSFGQRLFQDASGNTQIPIGKITQSFLFYNTSDKSATLGYSKSNTAGGYDIRKWEMDWVYGLDLKIKTTDGIGNFFSKNEVNPGFTLSGNVGLFKDNWLKKSHYLNISFRPQIGYNQYTYIHTATPDYKLDKVKKVEGAALLNLSTQFNFSPKPGSDTVNILFFFVQTGFRQVNNVEDLDNGQITTIKSQSGMNVIETIETGKLGEYERSNVMPLNIDLAFTPRMFKTNLVGFNTYFRTNFFKKVNTSNAGFGIYLGNAKKPSEISGGIGWQFNDLSDKLKKGGSLIDRSAAFFYVGFAIGSK